MKTLILLVLFVPLFTSAQVTAWDESVDGDLSSNDTIPTVISLVDGDNDIFATIGSSTFPTSGDGQDVMQFDLPAGATINSILLMSYTTAGGNTSTGFNIFINSVITGAYLGGCACTAGNVGADILTLGSPSSGVLSGGVSGDTYVLDIREFTAPGQIYSLRVNYSSGAPVVPTLSEWGLIVLSFLMLTMVSLSIRANQGVPGFKS